jgi:hypothetical protein
MFPNIPLIADWHTVTQRQEHLINENPIGENKKHRQYDYVPQQKLLKKEWKLCKLGKRTSGPYRVLQTHVNGILTIGSKTRHLRETQHKKGYNLQRAHSHIITNVQTTG